MLITETNTNNLKQGDKSTLSYICLTDTNFSGQSAKAVLKTRQNAVVYTTDTTIQDGNVVDFTIDTVLPVGRYILEIVVNDEYIYPDDNTIYLNVTASSLGAVVDSIESNSLDMVKGYIKSILADIETAFTKDKADELYQPKGDYPERSELEEYIKESDLKDGIEISSKSFIHTQQVANDTWEINHSLNKYPSVTIVDTSGNLVVGSVHYISTSKIVVKFSAPFSGVAYLN